VNHPSVGNALFVGARVAGLCVEAVIARFVWFFLAIVVGLFLVVFVLELPHVPSCEQVCGAEGEC
jgi:TRAP-type C4-dicarboxylate transport system permease large subunit